MSSTLPQLAPRLVIARAGARRRSTAARPLQRIRAVAAVAAWACLAAAGCGDAGAIAQAAYVKASNAAEADRFGVSVAVSGNTLAIGAPGESSAARGVDGDQGDDSAALSGAVYVFRRGRDGWVQEAYLKASNTAAGDAFGARVALSGDVLAVSAVAEDGGSTGANPDDTDDSVPDSGAVFVFRRSGGDWAQEAYLKSASPQSFSPGSELSFGTGLALAADTLAVGAPGEDGGGVVYVFRYDGARWVQEARLLASNAEPGDRFGGGVAVSGDTLAVGAAAEDSAARGVGGDEADNGASASGAVYVFERSGFQWAQTAYLKASNAGTASAFGASVAVSGDTLAVGAAAEDSAAAGVDGDQSEACPRESECDGSQVFDAGAVYVFERSGGAWAQDAFVKASNPGADDRFGIGVAVLGDRMAVGARFEASAAAGVDGDQADDSLQSGAVYLFERSAGAWAQAAYVKASNPDRFDDFGVSVALSDDALAVGAPGEGSAARGIDGDPLDNSADNSGAAYVFE